MHRTVITTDSTADIPPELAARYDIRIIPLTINLGGDSFPDSESFTPEILYSRYHKDGTLPQTAAPSVQAFSDFFSSILIEGAQIVHLDISAELSNSYNAARLAASELGGVYVVDTRNLCCGIALLALEGAECRDRGMEAGEIARHLEELTGKVSASFVLDTLTFMWKGGRCSGVTALGANLLNIKPVLEMRGGKLAVVKKLRGSRKNVYRRYLTEQLEGRRFRTGHVFFTNSGEIEPEILDEMEELVRSFAGDREVHRSIAGCTISSHCGPGTLAVFYIEE